MVNRLENIVRLLKDQALDAVIINEKVTKRYLNTMEGSGCHLFVTQQEAFLILDGRYYEEAKEKEKDLSIILWNPQNEGSDYLAWIKQYVHEHMLQALGVEKNISIKDYSFLEKFVDVRILQEAFERLRMIKNENDISLLKKAIHTGDEIYKQVLNELYIGMTDYEISAKLQYYSIKAGASRMSFDTIIGIGERSAYPHGRPVGKVVEKNQIIMIDFGLQLNGYESDMTRMCSFGDPSNKIKEIYYVVLEANQAGMAAMKTGNSCSVADQAARTVIQKAGYGEYFTHGLGHGIGMDNSTELPKVNAQSEMIFEEDMVVSCEPGVYVPHIGGMRIEDDVWIHNGVGEQLDRSSKELTIL